MDPYPFILSLLEDAGKLLLELRGQSFITAIKNNDPRDIVTSVDLALNTFMSDRIRAAFPEDELHSEENVANAQGSRIWTIDPIDGSSNFSRGIPHFAICLGISVDGTPQAGGVYNPITRELFSFAKGDGAFLNGAPLRVSDVQSLDQASVLFHAGRKLELQEWGGAGYRTLLTHAKKTANFGSTALDTCFVAAGRVEASVYGTMSTLDIAPAIGILTEAGGMMLDASGDPVRYLRAAQMTYAVCNRELFTVLRKVL
ncbi:MAG: inositol monophosphatase 1-like [Parcubacteria group bacterium]|nr:inositol monophosphatase 1-like [Parcubacteria group bacterium]